MNCKHNWHILDKVYMKSPLETLLEQNQRNFTKLGYYAMQSKTVIVYKCSKCKKIKESVHYNPE